MCGFGNPQNLLLTMYIFKCYCEIKKIPMLVKSTSSYMKGLGLLKLVVLLTLFVLTFCWAEKVMGIPSW